MSTAEVYSRRPISERTTATDIIRFALRSEIMEVARNRSFCGKKREKDVVSFSLCLKFNAAMCSLDGLF